MSALLPTSLTVAGEQYKIRPDYRNALLIFKAMNDSALTDYEKNRITLDILYKNPPYEHAEEAIDRAMWFLDYGDAPKPKQAPRKVMDWEQDETMIFPALNKVAGYELRTEGRITHWWTLLGLFNEVGEGLYSSVMNVRQKLAYGKKLESWEREFYNNHRELIDIREKLTPEEEEAERWLSEIVG